MGVFLIYNYRHTSVFLFLALLHFTDSFLQIEGLWQCYIKQVFWYHFSSSICLLHVSVSHFGNSDNKKKKGQYQHLEINQRLASISGEFIQEHRLNFEENSELCGVLTCLIAITPSLAPWLPRKPTSYNHEENQSRGCHWEDRECWSLFKVPFPEKCCHLTNLVSP